MSTDAPLTLDAVLLDPATLPDDAVVLKRVIVEFQRQTAAHVAAQLEAQRQRLDAELAARLSAQRQELDAQMQAERERLEAEKQAAIVAILRRYYSPRNERFDPSQLLLFGFHIEQQPLDEAAIAEEAGEELVTRRIKKRHKHGRNPLPDHLPRIEIEHDLTDEQKKCPCCGELRCRIGQEINEQLEYFPANLKVFKHIRHKYACRRCEQEAENPQIATAAKPPQPIDKGLPGPGLLAYVITSKQGDHLPLHRQGSWSAPWWN
jgi:transposase